MKPRLPYALVIALLASSMSAHATAVTIPDDYKSISVGGSYEDTITSQKNNSVPTAYVLEGDLTVDISPSTSYSRTYRYVENGKYIITSDSENPEHSLVFEGGRNTTSSDSKNRGTSVFYDSDLTISNLASLKMVYDENDEHIPYHAGFIENSAENKNVNITQNGNIEFEYICRFNTGERTAKGGVISNANTNNTVSLSENTNISFKGNGARTYASGTESSGGAIYSIGALTVSKNYTVSFENNVAAAPQKLSNKSPIGRGGAITVLNNNAEFSNNIESLEFKGNKASAEIARGGAIYFESVKDPTKKLLIKDNGNVLFEGNEAVREVHHRNDRFDEIENFFALGGAIAIGENSLMEITGTLGALTFDSNNALDHGGAIYAAAGGEVTINANNSVTFTNNYAGDFSRDSTGAYARDYKTNAVYLGGAIYSESNVVLSNNGSVSFTGNYLMDYCCHSEEVSLEPTDSKAELKGGAIYLDGNASLIIEGNDEVSFKGNYEKNIDCEKFSYSEDIVTTSVNLRAVYVNNANAENRLSAKTGGSIKFEDAVYMNGNTTINGTYLDKNGAEQQAGGEVIFTGAMTEEHLKAALGEGYTPSAEDVTSSRTSEFVGNVNVEGGTLKVESDATVKIGQTLEATENSNAQLVVDNATVEANSVNWNSGTLEVNNNGSVTITNGLTANADVTVNGGKITANTIDVQGGTLKLSDGTVNATTGGSINAKLDVSGGELNAGATTITLADNSEISGGKVTTSSSVSSNANVSISGGELNANTIDVQGGTLKLSGGTVNATSTTIQAGATLHVDGGTVEEATTFSLAEANLANSAVYGETTVATLNTDLTLSGGVTLIAADGNIDLNGHTLSLIITEGEKITLTLPDYIANDEGAKVILFSNVSQANFQMSDIATIAEAGADSITVNARDYFNSSWITEETTLNFDNESGQLYLQGFAAIEPPPSGGGGETGGETGGESGGGTGSGAIPEPTTTTLGLLALTAMLARRRRK